MEQTHGVTHWDPDDCFGCRIQTTNFAPSAMPSRRDGAHCAAANRSEKQLERDLPAYKRMRKAGMNPKSTQGAADLESRAESSLEVEMGKSFVDVAKGTRSYQSGDVGALRDVSRGAPEFRRRAVEANDEMRKTAWKRTDRSKPAEKLNA